MEKVGCSLIQLMIALSLICGVEAGRRRLGSIQAEETVRAPQADLDLYLGVMRATAARIRNPALEDLATMAAFERIKNSPSSPTTRLTREEKQIIQRAFLLTYALDEVVAQEKHVDADQYRSAKTTVESLLPAPDPFRRVALGIVTPAEWQALKSRGAAVVPKALEIRELQALVSNNPLRRSFTEDKPRTTNYERP